jgi:protein phosphatase
LAVCDGVGGEAKGDVASAAAAASLLNGLRDLMAEGRDVSAQEWQASIREAVAAAGRAVEAAAASPEGAAGMATTVAAVLLDGDRAVVAWVGDSRVYRVGGTDAHPLTKDHSLVQQWVDEGKISAEEAAGHPRRNIITRALGHAGSSQPEVSALTLDEDDVLVVCCDGLPGHVKDAEIAEVVRRCLDAQEACDELVALANARGGSDNISVVVAPASLTWG